MIVFDRDSVRFNYRAVGVALHERRVLLHRAEHDPFWALPGGRVELLESASDTLAREMQEELGTKARVARARRAPRRWLINWRKQTDVRFFAC